ncbi:MAG TPA: hypothetical protein VGM67_11900 [Gemmatimonadaceae bacterium]
MLIAVGVAIALVAFLGWRSLRATDPVRGAPAAAALPSPHLTDLMPFSQPLTDSVVVRRTAPTAVALAHDPFGALPAQNLEISHGERIEEPAKEAAELHVTATMMAGTRRAAVINDQLIYVGDTVPGGGKLTSVERDRVVVTDPKGAPHIVAVKEGDD